MILEKEELEERLHSERKARWTTDERTVKYMAVPTHNVASGRTWEMEK